MSVIDRASAVALAPALLKRVVQELAELPADQRSDFASRGLAMLCLLDVECPDIAGPRARAAVLAALDFRIRALQQLCGCAALGAWSHAPGQYGPFGRIHDALLGAAATEPLIACDGSAAFEPERFFRAVLRLCATEGRA